MPIRLKCPACDKKLRAPERLAGKTLRCPNCREAVRVGDLISIADIVPTLMGLVELPNEDVFLRQASGTDRLAEHAERPLVFSQESSAPWRTRRGERKPSYALTGNEWIPSAIARFSLRVMIRLKSI